MIDQDHYRRRIFEARKRLYLASGGVRSIMRFVEQLVEQSARHVEGAPLRESQYADILERWSDEARAASIAARRAKAKGRDWRKAARDAFLAGLSPRVRRQVLQGAPAGDVAAPSHRAAAARRAERFAAQRQALARRAGAARARYAAYRSSGMVRTRFGWE